MREQLGQVATSSPASSSSFVMANLGASIKAVLLKILDVYHYLKKIVNKITIYFFIFLYTAKGGHVSDETLKYFLA
jgi:hypothetical protein